MMLQGTDPDIIEVYVEILFYAMLMASITISFVLWMENRFKGLTIAYAAFNMITSALTCTEKNVTIVISDSGQQAIRITPTGIMCITIWAITMIYLLYQILRKDGRAKIRAIRNRSKQKYQEMQSNRKHKYSQYKAKQRRNLDALRFRQEEV